MATRKTTVRRTPAVATRAMAIPNYTPAVVTRAMTAPLTSVPAGASPRKKTSSTKKKK